MQMDELACFAPGMLALGSSGYGPDESKKFLSLAEEVLSSRKLYVSSLRLIWSCFVFHAIWTNYI